jgi:hypothetical protein
VLVDNYLKTQTPVDLNGTTSVTFTVNGEAGSAAANRFSITFSKPSIVVNTAPAIMVYPNPVTNGNVRLQFTNMPKGIYLVRIVNSKGQTVLSRQVNHAGGSNTETIVVNPKGAYMIEVIKPDNSRQTNKLIIN